MPLSTRIALLVAIIATVVTGTEVHKDATHGVELNHREAKLWNFGNLGAPVVGEDYETDIEGRRRKVKDKKGARLNFGIIDGLIDFEGSVCETTDATCMSQKECVNMNGTVSEERCANTFGVCCTLDSEDADYLSTGGNTTISGDGGPFINPPATVTTRDTMVETVTYTATVVPGDDKVQIEVDIISMDIAGPVEGDCGNSSLTITGTNPGPQVPDLCGVVNNQKLYLDIDNPSGPIVFTMMITLNGTQSQIWNISIALLSTRIAPPRCLQYYSEPSGSIESFNVAGDPAALINDQMYSICFAYVSGYCDVALTFTTLDMPCSYGYLLIGDDQFCDIEPVGLTANATGPISIGVRSGSSNDLGAEGFKATYLMLGC